MRSYTQLLECFALAAFAFLGLTDSLQAKGTIHLVIARREAEFVAGDLFVNNAFVGQFYIKAVEGAAPPLSQWRSSFAGQIVALANADGSNAPQKFILTSTSDSTHALVLTDAGAPLFAGDGKSLVAVVGTNASKDSAGLYQLNLDSSGQYLPLLGSTIDQLGMVTVDLVDWSHGLADPKFFAVRGGTLHRHPSLNARPGLAFSVEEGVFKSEQEDFYLEMPAPDLHGDQLRLTVRAVGGPLVQGDKLTISLYGITANVQKLMAEPVTVSRDLATVFFDISREQLIEKFGKDYAAAITSIQVRLLEDNSNETLTLQSVDVSTFLPYPRRTSPAKGVQKTITLLSPTEWQSFGANSANGDTVVRWQVEDDNTSEVAHVTIAKWSAEEGLKVIAMSPAAEGLKPFPFSSGIRADYGSFDGRNGYFNFDKKSGVAFTPSERIFIRWAHPHERFWDLLRTDGVSDEYLSAEEKALSLLTPPNAKELINRVEAALQNDPEPVRDAKLEPLRILEQRISAADKNPLQLTDVFSGISEEFEALIPKKKEE